MSETSSPLSHFTFPRTGKRGVPQQFPRRLYEMLDGETKNAEADMLYPKIIAWSSSGKAFRIHNVGEFSSVVLPKYFRTKKFSSFQRNLNLYGFAKVRKGADTDMYAHPSFIRNKPEALLYLQKSTTRNKQDTNSDTPLCLAPRSVSPSLSHTVDDTNEILSATMASTRNSHFSTTIVVPGNSHCWETNAPLILNAAPVSPPSRRTLSTSSESDASSTGSNDRGKLDLLAFALEQEIACYH